MQFAFCSSGVAARVLRVVVRAVGTVGAEFVLALEVQFEGRWCVLWRV